MWLAQRQDVGAATVVLYYAARAVTAGSPVPVLAHFADVDAFVSESGRRRMESELDRRSWPTVPTTTPGPSTGSPSPPTTTTTPWPPRPRWGDSPRSWLLPAIGDRVECHFTV